MKNDKAFTKSQWIWRGLDYTADEYAEFIFDYEHDDGANVTFNIASDSNYNLLINGEVVAFGQYADYPEYKVYDSLDLTKRLKKSNRLSIIVWYYGKDSQTYIKDDPGVIFELVENGEIKLASTPDILSRKYDVYENGYLKSITSQLGLSFKYYGNKECSLPFTKSVAIEKGRNFNVRPCEKLVLGNREATSVQAMPDGSYVVDLFKETVGFIDLEFVSPVEQLITVGYSEHLEDGKVPYKFRGMDFSVEYVCKKGENHFKNYFRRLAGRYLQIFCDTPIEIKYAGILSTDYPVTVDKPNYESELRNQIFDVAVRTLSCCMHEHYEDCPRREQALYAMDSRNEMLCTYIAFNDYKFARSNLVLMTKGLRDDGLLSLCYPAGRDIPIPFFSLIFSVQTYEYVKFSKDLTILDETLDTCEAIINTFAKRVGEDGLIKNLPYPYWNFYEWSPRSDNGDQISRKPTDFYPEKTDLILNCMYSYSLTHYKKLCELSGKPCDIDVARTEEGIKRTFFVEETGLFKGSDIGEEYYTVLGNSLAILCGLGGASTAEKLINSKTAVPITLSMNTFLYEALIKVDREKYKSFILNDIDRKYKGMLDQGATTFWETEDGAKAIVHTGSLCHGWSAMPIYYYNLLNGKDYFDGAL